MILRPCHRAISYEVLGMEGEVSALAQRLISGLPDWETWRRRIDDLGRVVSDSLFQRLRLTKVEVSGLEQRLVALNPAAILRRGFSVIQLDRDGVVVSRANQVQGGDGLTITVSDGVIPATAGAGVRADSRVKRRKVSVQPPSMERLL